MNSHVLRFALTTCIGVMFESAAIAQTNPTPPTAGTISNPGDGGAASLAASEGISLADARLHLQLQNDISQFLATSTLARQAGFSELYVRHNPFQIVLSFDRDVPQDAIKALVPENLRSFIVIEMDGKAQTAQTNFIAQINTALTAAKAKIALGYSPLKKSYFIDTADDATTRLIAPLIPANLRSLITINTGALPKSSVSTTATPTGVASGDWAEAGYTLTRPDKTPACTAAFPVTFGSGLQGILTAGHCHTGGANSITFSTHVVTFPDAYYSSNAGNYDYALYRTDGMTSDYQLYYSNPQGTAGYASSGWLNTKNFVRLANQWVGMYVCKSGATTGITCAKIVSKTYDWGRPGSVFVRWVSPSATTYIADYGDSGSPAFATLDSAKPSEISAVGLVVGGHAKDPDGYVGVIMPIDRVFDNVASLKLITSP